LHWEEKEGKAALFAGMNVPAADMAGVFMCPDMGVSERSSLSSTLGLLGEK